MNENRIYLDSSAYLSMLLGESDAEKIRKLLHRTLACSSTFLILECERNLIRAVRQKALDELAYDRALQQFQLDIEGFLLRDLTLDLCFTRDFPLVKTPRSADLIHLRTAVWFQKNGGIKRFVSLAQHQLASARELGLPI